jgi:transposase
VDRTGCQWAYLPHDFPPHQTVYGYFAKWQTDGIFAQLNGLSRELVRQQEGQHRHLSACVIDAQSVKTSTSVPARTQGIDADKKIVGCKRSIITDTLGLLLAVLVTAAGIQDSTDGRALLERPPQTIPPCARSGSTAATASTSSSTPPPWASTSKIVQDETTGENDLSGHDDPPSEDQRQRRTASAAHCRGAALILHGCGASRVGD